MNVITIKNELLQSATYFIGDYLVDCGGSDRIFESLEGRELNGIFLTHCHQDHVYGLEKVLEKFQDLLFTKNVRGLEGSNAQSLVYYA